DALAELVEVLTGEAAFSFRDLYVKHGLLQMDIDEVAARDRGVRLAAIARLARVRHQGALRALLAAAGSKDSQTAKEALRAMARTVAYSRPGWAVDQMVAAMYAAGAPAGEVEVLVRLTGDHAAAVTSRLLTAEDDRYALPAIRTVAKLRLSNLTQKLGAFLDEDVDPALREAAVAALAEAGKVPPGFEDKVAAALLDRDRKVAEAAARAAATIPGRMLLALEDAARRAEPAARRRAIAALESRGPHGHALATALIAGAGEGARPSRRHSR